MLADVPCEGALWKVIGFGMLLDESGLALLAGQIAVGTYQEALTLSEQWQRLLCEERCQLESRGFPSLPV